MSLQDTYIGAYKEGYETNKKPFLLNDQAWQILYNGYVFRERVKKKEALKFLGRLRRILSSFALTANISSPGAVTVIYNIFTNLSFISPAPPALSEPNAELEPGNIVPIIITIAGTINQTLTDNTGTGILTIAPANKITAAFINYITGDLTLTFNAADLGSAATISAGYYPSLPVMGIETLERVQVENEATIWFDQKYAYQFSGTGFQEFLPASAKTWDGNDADFFWSTNYRGSTPNIRLFFVTNDAVDTGTPNPGSPIRYTDGATWTDFAPQLDAAGNLLTQTRILIPYYGRLLALNTWEGLNAAGSVNFFQRARYSQIGDPTAADAWRSDIVGKGGFIDAPTGESITTATFFKNTLIVGFERSTWQLRYVGEYGIPFIWERISSDFGCESTFSNIVFDDRVLTVADKGIVASESIKVKRIDEQIPDTVFSFRNAQSGIERVQGLRDFQKELAYWCYADSNFLLVGVSMRKFPNRVLVYNYRNQTWAINRDNITAFGTFQPQTNVTWGRFDILWNNTNVTWQDFDNQSLFPTPVCGNQQGFCHFYNYSSQNFPEPSLSITNIQLIGGIWQLTIINHNLEDEDTIFLTGMKFLDSGTGLSTSSSMNNSIFSVHVIDANTISLSQWSFALQQYITNFTVTYTPALVGTANYIGAGRVTLFSKISFQTKDFNPYQTNGLQMKLSSINFLFDNTNSSSVSVKLYINSSPSAQGNIIVGNKNVETFTPSPLLQDTSQYTWHSFYATQVAQYININLTYDDNLMNLLGTHQQIFVLNAMDIKHRPGGKIIF